MLNIVARTAMFGTIECDIGGKVERCSNTTPASITLFKMIDSAVANGCKNLTLEISSHGICEKRAYGLHVDVAVFTNLSREHMDFHGTMDNYFAAKKQLFDGTNGCQPKHCVINADDCYGEKLLNSLKGGDVNVISFGFSDDADFKICNVVENCVTGSVFEIVAGGVAYKFRSRLFGDHNLLNIAASFASSAMIYDCREKFVEAVGEFDRVPGRLERVTLENGANVFIDYAHTPRALKTVLGTLKMQKIGKLITVFGCGGDRDTDKRAPMTKITNEMSDFAIATSDNPRMEPQEKIFSDMEFGVVDRKKITFIGDRREAIATAIAMSGKGDVILVSGKGHETYQLIGGKTMNFNDRDVVLSLG
jgi:UDP-N-acetylmuramoyl-L-alanyl-D-glutamate--2,6-diaminopimelate ligase